jgi:putative transposase
MLHQAAVHDPFGAPTGCDRVRNLMQRMGLRAIYQKPHTTLPGEPAEQAPGAR